MLEIWLISKQNHEINRVLLNQQFACSRIHKIQRTIKVLKAFLPEKNNSNKLYYFNFQTRQTFSKVLRLK
jgi:hypothetical protein